MADNGNRLVAIEGRIAILESQREENDRQRRLIDGELYELYIERSKLVPPPDEAAEIERHTQSLGKIEGSD